MMLRLTTYEYAPVISSSFCAASLFGYLPSLKGSGELLEELHRAYNEAET